MWSGQCVLLVKCVFHSDFGFVPSPLQLRAEGSLRCGQCSFFFKPWLYIRQAPAHKDKDGGCHGNWAKIVGDGWRRAHTYTLINTQTLWSGVISQSRRAFLSTLPGISPYFVLSLSLFHSLGSFSVLRTLSVIVYCMCVGQCNLLTSRLIGKCGVFARLRSRRGGLEAPTCASIIPCSALQWQPFISCTHSYGWSSDIYYTHMHVRGNTPLKTHTSTGPSYSHVFTFIHLLQKTVSTQTCTQSLSLQGRLSFLFWRYPLALFPDPAHTLVPSYYI